jgi:hypothetical protein
MLVRTICFFYLVYLAQVNCQKGDYNFTSSCNDCEFWLKWNDNGNQTSFVFSVQLPTEIEMSGWAAFSFSKDLNMGNDDMHVCKSLGVNSTVEHYFKGSDGAQAPTLIDSTSPTFGLSNINVKLNKQLLTCSFTRANKMMNDNYFPLPNKYHLLLSYGGITNGLNNILIEFFFLSEYSYNF